MVRLSLLLFIHVCLVNAASPDILAIHISKQNAGVILRKPAVSHLTLEFFQASPTAAAVASTISKLIIQFPSRPRLSFPIVPSAIESLCALLVDLDCTEMPDAMPVTRKAQSEQVEVREVADIRYVSELLGGIARACTEDAADVAERTTYITKRIDDHVLWKSCLLPWRRTPLWMIIRVVLQTSLKEMNMDPAYGYKVFTTFVLARLLERSLGANIPLDLLFTMNAKMAIRVSKLCEAAQSSPFLDYIALQNRMCGDFLGQRWQDIQAVEKSPLSWIAPTPEEINRAKGFSLTNSRAYLSEVYNRSKTLSETCHQFDPISFKALLPPVPPEINRWIEILNTESWVAHEMNDWLSRTSSLSIVKKLMQSIAAQDRLAASFGETNPELFSRVFLTQMELWVALDKTVIDNIPLLANYSPQLDPALLEPLLLPTLDQMVRVQAIEDYLRRRHSRVTHPQYSIFEFVRHRDSFPARYFNEDPTLQALRSEIQDKATSERALTRENWKKLRDQYNDLTREADMLEHTYTSTYNRWGDDYLAHSMFCKKCSLDREAARLSVDVHEWPLPEDEILSRFVVFELRLPEAFGVWRDATFSLARRYTSVKPITSPDPVPVLHKYPALSAYFKANSTVQQLTIASVTKSFLVSHYRCKKFPCNEDDVIKKNGLRFNLFDTSSRGWITPSVFIPMSIREQCTPSLPPGPYVHLAWSIAGTKHTPNMVIARQSECPAVITYHEWDAFGHLRAGNRIQWRNMMLELVRGTLTLGDPAAYLLFRQAAWQAEMALSSDNNMGSQPRREAHLDLSKAEFGQEILSVLCERFTHISANWQEGWTVSILSVVACRLFSLSDDEKVKEDVRNFMVPLRDTLSGWLKQVLRLMKSQAADITTEGRNELRDRVIQLAVSCRSTYMLDDEIARILRDSNALTLFIDSAIVLQSIIPPNISSLPSPLRYMVERDMMLSAEVVNLLRTAINSNNFSLDDAIRRNLWQGFRRDPCVPWEHVGDSWVTSQTSSKGNSHVCYVYFNLYDGSFLVDGKTIGGLPKNILGHSLFQTLFPNQVHIYMVQKLCKTSNVSISPQPILLPQP
jgi:hypothetical protein